MVMSVKYKLRPVSLAPSRKTFVVELRSETVAYEFYMFFGVDVRRTGLVA